MRSTRLIAAGKIERADSIECVVGQLGAAAFQRGEPLDRAGGEYRQPRLRAGGFGNSLARAIGGLT